MKLKRYDKVKVRTDLVVGKDYCSMYGASVFFTKDMEKFKGCILTIDWEGAIMCATYESSDFWCVEMFEIGGL